MALRPFQTAAIDAVKNRKVQRGVIALPTGTGKGHIAGHLTEAIGSQRILYLAHREELINQLADHVERVLGWGNVSVEQADRTACYGARAVVASVPTLIARDCHRLKRIAIRDFDGVVVDEAHHSTAESYRKLWRFLGFLDDADRKIESPRMPLIGLTATPGRGDGIGLNNVFDDILYRMSLTDAIKQGWLVPVHGWTIKTGTSLSGVRTKMGDYVESDLAKVCDTEGRTHTIVKSVRQYAKGRKTLVFCINIEHAQHVAECFREYGMDARDISGKSADREDILKWFDTTPGAVLTNCQLLTEGVDIPSVECVVMARPTKSATLYAQCLGRGTRLARGAADIEQFKGLGKDRLILLDITDEGKGMARRAVNIGDIFGSPLPAKEYEGQQMVEEIEEQQEVVEAARRGDYSKVEVCGIPFSLFAVPAELPGAKMVWQDYGDTYRLSLGKDGDITLSSDVLDSWRVVYWNPVTGQTEALGEPYGIQEAAVAAAEIWVRETMPTHLTLVRADASWRSQRPSPAQLSLCRRMHIHVPEGATKGMVSMMLDRRIKRPNGKQTTPVEAQG